MREILQAKIGNGLMKMKTAPVKCRDGKTKHWEIGERPDKMFSLCLIVDGGIAYSTLHEALNGAMYEILTSNKR